ncbi:WD40/YVTN repeat-like-containing domain,WD40-repeat-containing domain [Cinara cedri]|uniref:WD40/YVTN repeat-like-containing domain,WD40-repeat-containing domain n=1 Tax=Cinara cedri TaxID=506608 RepID=A0A5E4NN71_9HEMI|nr:WD40/YVTN repeat-like-containing domain,WD40-repeat-containing domain [Cinara cedri]
MDFNEFNYLQNRELGFSQNAYGFRQKITENLIGKMGSTTFNMSTEKMHVGRGSIMSGKFSKMKNNSHIFTCTTSEGKIIILNTNENIKNNTDIDNSKSIFKNHRNIIFDHAWADSSMKFVTASGDQTSKIFQLLPSGNIELQNIFNFEAPVNSVKFCPGSSGRLLLVMPL